MRVYLKRFLILLLLLIMAAGFTGATAHAAALKLSSKMKRITAGQKTTVTLKNTKKSGKWKISDGSTVKIVKKSGKSCTVYGIKKGSAILTCKVGKKTLKCKIVVEVPSLGAKTIRLHKGKSYSLKIKGTGGTPAFSYTNHTCVKVTKKSKYLLSVKALKEGSSVITVTINRRKYKSKVTVKDHFPSDSWEHVADPTTEKAGYDVRRCTVCKKAVEKREIARLPSVAYLQKGYVNTHTQDAAVYGDYLVTCHGSGIYGIYDVHTLALLSLVNEEASPFMRPHCNSVCFGTDFYAPDDPFPLLYCNVYNKYSASATDRREGICLVYRLVPEYEEFTARLVQMIRIGFVEDRDYWKSLAGAGDLRPFGNFVIDPEHRKLIAYVPRDKTPHMRYFVFDLPPAPSYKDEDDGGGQDTGDSGGTGEDGSGDDGSSGDGSGTGGTEPGNGGGEDPGGDGPSGPSGSDDPSPGELNSAGIYVYTLGIEDILEMHDSTYLKVIQGNCLIGSKLYVLAGLSTIANPATLGVIDLNTWSTKVINLRRDGLTEEPELIYYDDGSLYYGTYSGEVFKLDLLV